MVDVADSGSIGFASLPFLFAHCKIRGCHFPNPLHRLHDDHNNAIAASGLPSMQEAAMEYFSSANASGELYLLMYPYIVVDLWLGQIFSDMGTPEHYDFVWRMPPDLGMLQPSGRIYESTRPQVRAHDEVLVLLFCGVSLGSFTSMADAPLPGGSHLVGFIAERAPTPSGANGDAREAETHDAPKPPSSACGVLLLPNGSPRNSCPRHKTRRSPGFSPIACLVLS